MSQLQVAEPPAAPVYLHQCLTIVDLIEQHWLPLITKVLPQGSNLEVENIQTTMISKMNRFIEITRDLQWLPH
jgi:hypothetical protein